LNLEDYVVVQNSAIPNNEVNISRPTERKNKCGICRSLEHTRNKCPLKNNDPITASSSSSSSSSAKLPKQAKKRKSGISEENQTSRDEYDSESGDEAFEEPDKYKGSGGDSSDDGSELSEDDSNEIFILEDGSWRSFSVNLLSTKDLITREYVTKTTPDIVLPEFQPRTRYLGSVVLKSTSKGVIVSSMWKTILI